jgi:hypothetical protein
MYSDERSQRLPAFSAADPIPSYVPTGRIDSPVCILGPRRKIEAHYLRSIGTDGNRGSDSLGVRSLKFLGYDLEKRGFVIRGGFGISHVPINGNNRSAFPDFGGFTEPGTSKPANATANASTGTQFPLQPFRLTGNQPIQGSTQTLDQLLGTDANGLVFNKAVVIPGIAVDINDPNYAKVPTAQNWNVAVQWEVMKNSTIEFAYVGNRGVHLFTPQININQRDISTISLLTANNINPTANVADPLGRTPLLGGTTAITTQVASLFSQYMGYEPLNKYFNANSSSIRHAFYVDFRRRVSRGLSFTANYTWAKSFDDSSDASPDVRVLTSGSVKGQVALVEILMTTGHFLLSTRDTFSPAPSRGIYHSAKGGSSLRMPRGTSMARSEVGPCPESPGLSAAIPSSRSSPIRISSAVRCSTESFAPISFRVCH